MSVSHLFPEPGFLDRPLPPDTPPLTPDGSTITLAMVGLGKQAINKALPAIRTLSQSRNVSLAAAVDSNPQSHLPADVNRPIFPTIEDMVAKQGPPTAAYVAVPHFAYENVLSSLFSAGVDFVIKEKPLAMSLNEALHLVNTAKFHGVKLCVSAQRRFSQRYDALASFIPLIGAIRSVQAVEKIVVPDMDEGWRASKSLSGGGVVLDLGYHMLDQLIGLFGESVTVEHATLLQSRQGCYDVEDTAHLSLRFDGGVEANVILSRAGTRREEGVEVVGEEGVIKLDGNTVQLIGTDGRVLETRTFKESSSYLVAKSIEHALFYGGADVSRDLAVMRLVEAVYARAQKPVDCGKASDSPRRDVVVKRWSWPNITPSVVSAVTEQLGTTVSIYDNSGIFREFETAFKTYHGRPNDFALLHNSGTNALHGLYYAAGLTRGDEVIVPVYTFHATVSPLMQLGVVPIFVDADAVTGNIDPRGIERAVGTRTKAVVVTHMWGAPCDMLSIVKICQERNLLLLEDCSHAHGATVQGQMVGTFGDGAAWSLQGEKVVTGGEGGISLTKHAETHYRMLIWGHYNKRCKVEIPPSHPLHAFSLTGAGLKNRAHPLAVSLALSQLKQLPLLAHWKRTYASYLAVALSSVPFLEVPDVPADQTYSWYAFILRFNATAAPRGLTRERYANELVARGLKDVDIPGSTRPLWKEPLYRQPWVLLPHLYDPDTYVNEREESEFPGSTAFYKTAIKLPVWADQGDADVVRTYARVMVDVAKEFLDGCLPLL